MASKTENPVGNQKLTPPHRLRWGKIALWLVSIVAAFGILGFFAAPPLLRNKLTSALSQQLHREVSIEQVQINPFTLTAKVSGLAVKERQGTTITLSFAELFANLGLESLFRLAPVLKELRLVKPYVHLVRNENGSYNFQDVIDEFMAGPSGPTPGFALHNIRIIDGAIDFDDRPKQAKHKVSALNVGVPFISSIPSYVDVKVKPEFSAVVNGAPFHLAGDTVPFKDSRESTLSVDIDKLEIPKYLEYSPVALNFTMPSGQLNGKLTSSFKTSTKNPSVLSITGNLGLKEVEIRQSGGAPLLKLPNFDVVIATIEVFANTTILKSIKSAGFELFLNRGRDGNLNVSGLVGAPAKPPVAEPKQKTSPFSYSVDEILIDSGVIHFTDQGPEKPYTTRLDKVRLEVKGLTNDAEKKADVALSFESEAKERFNHAGTVQLTPLLAEGKLAIEGLQLKGLRPYYENVIGVEFKDGLLDLTTQVVLAQKGEELDAKLSELNASLRSLRMDVPGESEPLWRVALLSLKDTSVDIGKRSVVIGSVESRDGNGYVQREPDGTISYARLIKTRVAENLAKQPVKEENASWSVDTKRLALSRFKIVFEDRSLAAAPRLVVSELSVRGENFSNVQNSRAKATLQATINDKGSLKLAGTVGTRPVAGRLEVGAQGIDVIPFRPYFTDQFNFLFTRGMIGAKGNLVFDTSGDGPAKISYDGGAQILDFATVEKSDAQDLLKWKSLALDGVQFHLEPFQLRIGEINLGDFYSRLIIGPDGKINLQNLTVQKDEKKSETPAPAKAAEKTAAPPASDAGAPKAISIGKINLQEGSVNFSDFFIKPNYSANLTSVQGAISELKPEAPGDLDLRARLDNAAPVEIKGKINPLSKDLFLDIVADAKEIELSPMSPYSGKYVGYGIEKGKLSFNLKYKIDNRKLDAENKIILNQLTFGEKINSPDATNLPVLLAVALLKDRNGVIDINLPIGGSLDDPKFSVGGIIWQIIVNIIVKAVTSPFALLGAAFGGGGEELSYIEFDYGRTTLAPTAEAKIKTLVAAMDSRPALKLEISGRVDPVNDRDGVQKVSIERKVKAQKLKELVRQGSAPSSVDEVKLEIEEYEKYLKAAYGEESFAKPRNLIGLAKDLPVPEMEELMMKNAKVSDDDLRELGNRRAQTVRDRVLAAGPITTDRLFIVAAKDADAEKEKAQAKLSRVDFALR